MRILVVVAATAILALTACTQKPALVEVNKRRLQVKELDLRTQQMKLLQPDINRARVVAGLVEGWVAAELMAARGQEISRDQLISERAKLEVDPKIARLYREVSRIYGDESETFLNVGLLPDIALRRAHEIFTRENSGAKDSEEKAALMLRATLEQAGDFEPKAKEAGAELHQVSISLDGTVADLASKTRVQLFAPTADADKEAAAKVFSIAQRSEPETVLGLVLKTSGGHMLLKRLGGKDDTIEFATAIFPKLSFGEWLHQEAKKLHEAGDLRTCLDVGLQTAYEQVAVTNLVYCP